MARKNIKRTAQEKKKIVLEYQNGSLGLRPFAKTKDIDPAQIFRWNKAYNELGIKGLQPKQHKIKKMTSSMSELEKIKLENIKLKIENERLKKGYSVKGVGTSKKYISIKEVNSKSSNN